MAFTTNKKLKYIGCSVLAVFGVVLIGLLLAVISFARNAPSYGSCDPVSDPRTRPAVTPYPGATWVDGKICGAFFSSTTSHLYVSPDDISVVSAYYQEAMTTLADSMDTELHNPRPNQFTISVTGDGSYMGVGVTITTTPPEDWTIGKKTKAGAKTYIIVSKGGGLS